MPAPIAPRHRATFAACASVEAIEAHLASRRTDRRAIDQHIAWLEELLTARRRQIATGQWPPELEPQSGP